MENRLLIRSITQWANAPKWETATFSAKKRRYDGSFLGRGATGGSLNRAPCFFLCD